MSPRCRHGFTFTEMVIALSIVAILAAILFPVFSRAREKGRQASCLTNLHNIGAALRMYALEHYGHLPPVTNDFSPLLTKHLPEPAALVCPSFVPEYTAMQYPPPRPAQIMATPMSYVYRAGVADDDLPSTIIAADLNADLHNSGANYLWVDGHGKWLSATHGWSGKTPNLLPEVQVIDALRTATGGRPTQPLPSGPPGGGPGGAPGGAPGGDGRV